MGLEGGWSGWSFDGFLGDQKSEDGLDGLTSRHLHFFLGGFKRKMQAFCYKNMIITMKQTRFIGPSISMYYVTWGKWWREVAVSWGCYMRDFTADPGLDWKSLDLMSPPPPKPTTATWDFHPKNEKGNSPSKPSWFGLHVSFRGCIYLYIYIYMWYIYIYIGIYIYRCIYWFLKHQAYHVHCGEPIWLAGNDMMSQSCIS